MVSFFIAALLFSLANSWGPSDIKYVHVVASNHFDAGYTDFTLNVLNEYFDKYLPEIPVIGEQLAKSNIPWQFMEHAWVLSLYMQCPPNIGLHCPNATTKQTFIDAVNKQQITWYAFPFNSELELYGPSMVEFGNYLSMKQLPSLFSTPHIPTTVSQRDVPGMTRSMIPWFRKSNVTAISIGANGRVAPLDVPQVFRWNDQQSGEEIVGIFHPGGYGGTDIKSVAMVDNFPHALATYWNGDNAGPMSASSVTKTLKQIQSEFPNAQVKIETFETFVDALYADKNVYNALPVFTEEMGDTWIYGPPSDPLKMAKFRAAQRLRSQCLASNKCDLESFPFFNFSRFLLKNGEHTFGSSYNFIGANYSETFWTNQQLNFALTTQPYKTKFDKFRQSWFEQRSFGIDYAINALSSSTDINEKELYQNIMNEWNYLQYPSIPDVTNTNKWKKITLSNQMINVKINNKAYNVEFNPKTGAIISLKNTENGINYLNSTLSTNDGLGIFFYQTYTAGNFTDFWNEYNIVGGGCNLEYCKNGMEHEAPFTDTQYNAYTSVINFYQSMMDENVFLLEANLGNTQNMLFTQFGAPQKVYVKYNFSSTFMVTETDVSGDGFSIELLIQNKTYTRLPETMWFAFKPNIEFNSVVADKSGEWVNPNNVIVNGTYHLQSVSPEGCVESMFNDKKNTIKVYSLDAAVSAYVPDNWNEFTDIVTPFIDSNLQKGVSFALVNNFWGTNYPQWYPFDPRDANQTYRFNVYLS